MAFNRWPTKKNVNHNTLEKYFRKNIPHKCPGMLSDFPKNTQSWMI